MWLNQKTSSHGSGGWKSEAKMLADLVSLKASLLGLQMVTFLLYGHMAFPLCVYISPDLFL